MVEIDATFILNGITRAIIASIIFVCFSSSIGTVLYRTCAKLKYFFYDNSDEDFKALNVNNINFLDILILMIIILAYSLNIINFKITILVNLIYFISVIFIKIKTAKEINIKVDKANNNLKTFDLSEKEKIEVIELYLKLIQKEIDDTKKIIPYFAFKLKLTDLNCYLCRLDFNEDKKLISNIIQCNNVIFRVMNDAIAFEDEFTEFDDAFIKMINSIEWDKEIISNKKNDIKDIYEALNPNGNFENLNTIF